MALPLFAGLAGMLALNKFTSQPDKFGKSGTMTPQQRQSLNQLLSFLSPQGGLGQGAVRGAQYYGDLLNPESQTYQSLEQPYMQRFQQQTVPGLAERFAGLGAMGGGLSSSGFGQALSAAGANLQAQLAAMRTAAQQQAAGGLLGQYNQGMAIGTGQRAFENTYQPGNTGIFGPALASFGQGFGQRMGQGLFGQSSAGLGASAGIPYFGG